MPVYVGRMGGNGVCEKNKSSVLLYYSTGVWKDDKGIPVLGFLLPSCFVWVFHSSVQSLSHVRLFATSWTTAHQASLSIPNSQSLLKLMSIESVMPSSHLILCRPLLLPPSIFPSIRVFPNESALHIRWPKYWSFSFNTVLPMNTQD